MQHGSIIQLAMRMKCKRVTDYKRTPHFMYDKDNLQQLLIRF